MDIKKYEIVLNVIDRGSFVGICEEMGYTQSGITQMMNSVERELGFNIFLRSNKGIRLTAEGEEVLPYLRELVGMNARMEQRFGLIRGAEIGKVRVGTYHTIACAWLPQILREFRKRCPNIEVDILEEHSAKQLERSAQEGRIDLCFTSLHDYHTFDWIDLKMDPYCAILPKGHPLAEREYLGPEALMGDDFFMCRSLDGMDPDIIGYLKQCNVPLKTQFFSNSDYTILSMVEAGLGVSILPKLFLDESIVNTREIVVRDLYPQGCRRLGIGVRSLKNVSPAAQRFIQCTKDVLAKI